MGIGEFKQYFGGLPVADLRPAGMTAESIEPGLQPANAWASDAPYGVAPDEHAPDAIAWRIRVSPYEDDQPTYAEHFGYFVDNVDTTRVTALLLGCWDEDLMDSTQALDGLVAHAHRFPALRHLFLADVVQEESEISWIDAGDVGLVLDAFPLLEELVVRGSPDLKPLRHANLRTLRCESGGLPAAFVTALGMCELPALESLELWLGTPDYGGGATPADLAELLSGVRLPALTHLGLMNSDIQDDIAAAVAGAPLTARLTSLDLSMGTLGDAGAEALLAGQPLTHLERLRIKHHFLSDPTADRLRTTLRPHGVTVDLDTPLHLRDWGTGRYIAIAE